MRATRWVWILALGVLAVVGGCAPGTAPSGSPPATEGAAGPSASLRAGEPLPLLIDTDVAPDDLVALAFLVGSPKVEVRAITVSGTGEAHCGPGVDVVLRLLERLDAPPIAVACGRETPIAGDHAFPDAWRTGADDGSGLALPVTSREPFAGDAVQLIGETTDAVDGLRVPMPPARPAAGSSTTRTPRSGGRSRIQRAIRRTSRRADSGRRTPFEDSRGQPLVLPPFAASRETAVPVTRIPPSSAGISTSIRLGRPISTPWLIVNRAGGASSPRQRR